MDGGVADTARANTTAYLLLTLYPFCDAICLELVDAPLNRTVI